MKENRKWLVALREKNKLTQEDVARKIGVTRQMISILENTSRTPSVETAKKIAEVLGFEWTLFYDQREQNVS